MVDRLHRAKLGLPHQAADLLSLRFAIVLAILVPVTLPLQAPWPKRPVEIVHLAMAGLLVHATNSHGLSSRSDSSPKQHTVFENRER